MSLRPNARTEDRRNRYKVSVDVDKVRRRREEDMVEIRKNKREENLQKKRLEGLTASMASATQQSEGFYSSPPCEKTMLENLTKMVAGVMSEDINLQVEATAGIGNLLSSERNPPINEVIQSGVVPRLVQFLSRDDLHELQFEAAWALANIALGTSENSKVIIDSGAIPFFVRLVSSPSDQVREVAVSALGNVSFDSPKCRDLVLSLDAMMPLLAQFNDHSTLSMLRTATWTLSYLCRGQPWPAVEQTKPALPVLERLLHSTDEEVLTDACWALCYLSSGENERIQAVINAGVIPRLVQLLPHPSPSVLVPALHTVGNLVTGDEMMTQEVLNHQALPRLLPLLTNKYTRGIKKDACWTISNITAGNASQIQEVIEAGIILPLVHLLQNAQFDIKKLALRAVFNATSGGNHDQIKFFVDQGCIKPLCDLLICPDPRVVRLTLEGLENILKFGEAQMNQGYNLYAQMIDDAEGLEKIENLQSHDNNHIYEKAVKILSSYWAGEDKIENDFAPEDNQSFGFNFGNQSGNAHPTGGFNFG